MLSEAFWNEYEKHYPHSSRVYHEERAGKCEVCGRTYNTDSQDDFEVETGWGKLRYITDFGIASMCPACFRAMWRTEGRKRGRYISTMRRWERKKFDRATSR